MQSKQQMYNEYAGIYWKMKKTKEYKERMWIQMQKRSGQVNIRTYASSNERFSAQKKGK